MKNLPLYILSVLLLALGIKVFFFTSSKIAYIDTAKLMEGSKAMQTLKGKLKAETEKAKANADTLTSEFQKALQQHEKALASMSAREKKLSEELLRSKQQQVMQYRQALEQKLMQDEQSQSQDILKNINTKITEYGKAKHYTIVFATTNGNIAYADEAVDVTKDIIELINK